MEAILNGTYDGEYNKDKGVNEPKLSEGMIPVKYNGTTWIVCSEDDAEWYNYTDMKWANIMLSDGTYKASTVEVGQEVADSELGSMFVWIPRYAYSIKEYKVETDGEGTKQEITNVKFLVGTTNTDEEGTIHKKDYDADKQEIGKATPMIVHPAFKFGDKNITGFWSAKFEASMAEENLNTTKNNNVTTKTVKILPNKDSWRYIRLGKCLTNCINMNSDGNIYGLTEKADSHLMKNNEWGAIAYLTTSQYGKTPVINSNFSNYTEINGETAVTKYHAYTAGGELNEGYKAVTNQSTTGNVTGIYDLNGGTGEYVAAYCANKNSNISAYGTTTYFENNELKTEYKKYWDRYEVSEDEIEYSKSEENLWNKDRTYNNERKKVTDLRYDLMKNIKGDAMYEIIREYSYYGKVANDSNKETYAWLVYVDDTTTTYGKSYFNSDNVLIGICSRPFLIRGGNWWGGTLAGVFASSGGSGGEGYYLGFRPSVIVY